MKEYLSYFSAAAIWKIPYIEAVLGPEFTDTDSVDFTVSERSARSLKKAQTSSKRCIYSCGHCCQPENMQNLLVGKYSKKTPFTRDEPLHMEFRLQFK